MPISRKHVGDREPGDVQAYREGCRCYPCGTAKADYEKQQKADDWTPFVDAQPVRNHLDYLDGNGVGTMRVAQLAHVDPATVQHIRGMGTRKPNARVRTALANRILAIQPDIDTASDGGYIDSAGTYRRLTGLIALGFPPYFLARRRGGRTKWVPLLDSFPARVTGGFARSVRDLYDELSLALPEQFGLQAGEIGRARSRAAANRWPRPLEWDDDLIDDPSAQAVRVDRVQPIDERTVTSAELEDLRWILSTVDIDVATLAGRERVAERMGIDPKRVEYIVTKKLPKLAARELVDA